MTIHEIFVFNKMLGGHSSLYSLPQLADMKMTATAFETVLTIMVNRGLLKNFREFTDEGILIAKRIKDYKEAIKYIRIRDLSLGVIDQTKAVMIKPCSDFDYVIELLAIDDIVDHVLRTFSFIDRATTAKTLDEVALPAAQFKRAFTLPPNCLQLRTKAGDVITNEQYFMSDQQLYTYDRAKEIIYPQSREDTIKRLIERLVI
jgi:hypothetical protein